jgi:hypothetical protein
MAEKRKATAKRFGVLKGPRKKRVSVKDLPASKGGAVKGGAVRAAEVKGVAAAHGCPACPHPATFVPGR